MSPGPLTDKELEQLHKFMLHLDLDNSMTLSMLDGYLTAVFSGPHLQPPSVLMPRVWVTEKGVESVKFKTAAQTKKILGLIFKHMNDIAHTLTYEPEYYEPVLMEHPNDGQPISIIDDWCAGYMEGVMLDYAAWLPLLTLPDSPIKNIKLYGTDEGWEELQSRKLSIEEHQEIANSLEVVAREIHAFWLSRRAQRQ